MGLCVGGTACAMLARAGHAAREACARLCAIQTLILTRPWNAGRTPTVKHAEQDQTHKTTCCL
eukprot:3236728-Rhodomonas_salina.1